MTQIPHDEWEAMRNIDIRTVDPSTLADIQDVKLDPDKPQLERMKDYLDQIKNPYCFRCGSTIVKISHAKTNATFEECMEGFFRSM